MKDCQRGQSNNLHTPLDRSCQGVYSVRVQDTSTMNEYTEHDLSNEGFDFRELDSDTYLFYEEEDPYAVGIHENLDKETLAALKSFK